MLEWETSCERFHLSKFFLILLCLIVSDTLTLGELGSQASSCGHFQGFGQGASAWDLLRLFSYPYRGGGAPGGLESYSLRAGGVVDTLGKQSALEGKAVLAPLRALFVAHVCRVAYAISVALCAVLLLRFSDCMWLLVRELTYFPLCSRPW